MARPFPPIKLEEITIPPIIYGTGTWSMYGRQHECVRQALREGCTAFDIGPTPIYRLDLAATGIADGIAAGELASTDSLFIQVKISDAQRYGNGTIPFDHTDNPATQVEKTIKHINDTLLPRGLRAMAFLLHSPAADPNVTLAYWRALEAAVQAGQARFLGICNVSVESLHELYSKAIVKPRIVQNQITQSDELDARVRAWCVEHGAIYQAFGALASSQALLRSRLVGWLAEQAGCEEPQALYALLLSLDEGHICVLNGTSREERLKKNLKGVHRVGRVQDQVRRGFMALLEQGLE